MGPLPFSRLGTGR